MNLQNIFISNLRKAFYQSQISSSINNISSICPGLSAKPDSSSPNFDRIEIQEVSVKKFESYDSWIDNLIVDLAIKYRHDWKKISSRIKFRENVDLSPRFLQKRYQALKSNNTKSLKGKPYQNSEDELLIELSKELKYDWKKIASNFENRSPQSVKNRFYHLRRIKSFSNGLWKNLEQKYQNEFHDQNLLRVPKLKLSENELKLNVKDIEFAFQPEWLVEISHMKSEIEEKAD